ncbi:hypothetical protein [Saccharolobus islandicus]|uniref:hypothetical protein n=1 Tax=Saccharolobus islandicus TaxID=43080 RepID=UPI0003727C81|nr:hypothetical protein [Sulfolobus islandicus]
MKRVQVIAILFMIAMIALVIVYHNYFVASMKVYGYMQNSIMKYVWPQLIKSYNNTKSLTVNSTAFEIAYYNVSENELIGVLDNTSKLSKDLFYTSISFTGIVALYVLYIFIYYRFFIKKLQPEFIWHFILPFSMELVIIMLALTLGFTFTSSIFSLILTYASTIEHLIPINSARSIIDSLIFGLDIFLFIIEFLIERTSEREIEFTPTIINAIKFFYSSNKLLECINNIIIKLSVKILVIITFAFSLTISFTAYFNIAFLFEDLVFTFFIMQIIITLVLISLFTDFLTNVSFRIIKGRL